MTKSAKLIGFLGITLRNQSQVCHWDLRSVGEGYREGLIYCLVPLPSGPNSLNSRLESLLIRETCCLTRFYCVGFCWLFHRFSEAIRKLRDILNAWGDPIYSGSLRDQMGFYHCFRHR